MPFQSDLGKKKEKKNVIVDLKTFSQLARKQRSDHAPELPLGHSEREGAADSWLAACGCSAPAARDGFSGTSSLLETHREAPRICEPHV